MPRAYTTIRSKVSATSWRVRSLHGFGLLVANDHVLLMLADGAHLAVQLGHVAHLLEGAVHEVLAHGIDAEHAEHARAPQKAQQDQHHGDGPQHAKPDGELPHERKEIHDQVVLNGMLGPGPYLRELVYSFETICCSLPDIQAADHCGLSHAPAFE